MRSVMPGVPLLACIAGTTVLAQALPGKSEPPKAAVTISGIKPGSRLALPTALSLDFGFEPEAVSLLVNNQPILISNRKPATITLSRDLLKGARERPVTLNAWATVNNRKVARIEMEVTLTERSRGDAEVPLDPQ